MADKTDKRNASFLENAGKSAKSLATDAADLLLAPGKALAGAIESNSDKKVKAKADEIAKKNAGKTATQPDTYTHDVYDPQHNLIAKAGDPRGTDRRNQVAIRADEAAKNQAAAKIDERFGTNTAVEQATPQERTNLTFNDFLKETGGDPVKAREWLKAHPGYVPGEKTNAWLASHPVEETKTEEPKNESVEEPFEPTNNNVKKVEDALSDSDSSSEAADKVADAISADKEQKKQIREATKSIWSAIADGSLSKESAGYFLMDALMKQANNRQRRDSNYIENLSRAAHGDTILGYDVSNDEKSKYETQVLDPALERANEAAGIESQSNAQTSADLSTANQQQQYGEAVGPQGLAQTAAVNQAQSGTFDTLTNAMASGNQEEAQKAMDAALKDPQIDTAIKSLQMQLQQGTLNADIKAAELANNITEQTYRNMQAQAKLLGIEGDLKSAMAGAIQNLASGNIDIQSIMMLMLMSKFGVM